MKQSEFKIFREELIKVKFDVNDYYMCALYLWMSCTTRQLNILKKDIIDYAKEYVYDKETGYVTVGNITIK